MPPMVSGIYQTIVSVVHSVLVNTWRLLGDDDIAEAAGKTTAADRRRYFGGRTSSKHESSARSVRVVGLRDSLLVPTVENHQLRGCSIHSHDVGDGIGVHIASSNQIERV